MAILRKKARTLQIKLRDEIFEFLAKRIRTNVRRLEGALMRVASFASLSGKELTHEASSICSRTFCRRKRATRSRSSKSSGAWPSISTCASPT